LSPVILEILFDVKESAPDKPVKQNVEIRSSSVTFK